MAQTPDKVETCDTVRPQLALYTAGKLDAGETKRVAEHVASCVSCTQEVAFSKVLSVSGPRLPLATPPEDLFEKIALATYAAPPRRSLRETLLSWVSPAPTRLALGTAFAIGVAALVVLPRMSENSGLTTPKTATHPAVSHTQHKSVDVAPKQGAPALVQPTTPILSEKAMAKSTVNTVNPAGKSKASAAEIASEVPTTIPAENVNTTVAAAAGIDATATKTPAVPKKTNIKATHIAVHKSITPVAPSHVARPVETVTPSKTVVATNTLPNTSDEEATGTEDNGTAPDRDRMIKVAMADPSEMRMPTPATTTGAAEEATGNRVPKRITLGGAGSGGRPSQYGLSSRKASDLGIGGSNVTIVAAPAKID